MVRELTESRAKLVGGRSVLAERVAALQHEYLRVVRIADLSRAASKDNLEKASRAGRLAKQVCRPQHKPYQTLSSPFFATMIPCSYEWVRPVDQNPRRNVMRAE